MPRDTGLATRRAWWFNRRMMKSAAASVLLLATAATASPSLFSSRVPYDPLVAKLRASGGDPSRIVHARAAQDLTRLESGKRYKFAVDQSGALAIAPMPAEAANNEYVHPVLVAGGPVRTAGGIVVEHAAGKVTRVTVDQDSKAYCPTLQSLDAAVAALTKLGIAAPKIARQDRPPQCAAR